MNLERLGQAIGEMKSLIEAAITTATYAGASYQDGQKAKEALIRSQHLILPIHEVVKESIVAELRRLGRRHSVFPPLGRPAPELVVSGYLKSKKQDVVVLFDGDEPTEEVLDDGPLAGSYDSVGRHQSERGLVVGVRSQLSSVAKNFDTLMERAFAETLNLRLRLPGLAMGEVYVLPVVEYDDNAMYRNRVAWKARPVPVHKFVRTFLAISGRRVGEPDRDIYKYDRSALVLVDFRAVPPVIFETTEDLKTQGYLSTDFAGSFEEIAPRRFAEDLVEHHEGWHPPPV